MMQSTVLIAFVATYLLCGTVAFRPTLTTSRIAARRFTDLKLSSSDAELAKLQDSLFSSLNSELGLKLTGS
jgi:hypothetical protein